MYDTFPALFFLLPIHKNFVGYNTVLIPHLNFWYQFGLLNFKNFTLTPCNLFMLDQIGSFLFQFFSLTVLILADMASLTVYHVSPSRSIFCDKLTKLTWSNSDALRDRSLI